MHKIDGDRAVNGQFVPEDPGAGLPPTQLTPDWCNDVQAELADLIEHQDGGASLLQKGVAQIRAAVAAMIGRAVESKANRNGEAFTNPISALDGVYSKASTPAGNSHIGHLDSGNNIRRLEYFAPTGGIQNAGPNRGHSTRNIYNPDGSLHSWSWHENSDGRWFFGAGCPRWGDNLGWSNATSVPTANIADVPMISGPYILNGYGVGPNNQVINAPPEMVAAGYADIILLDRMCFDQRAVDHLWRLSVTSHVGPSQTGGVWERVREFNLGNNSWSETPWRRTDAIGLGFDQTWQDVTSSRAFDTTFTNTTGKPIMVSVGLYGTSAVVAQLIVDGIVVSRPFLGTGLHMEVPVTAIVPPGSTYRLTAQYESPSFFRWLELR